MELLDTVADGDELAGAPDKTRHLNRAHRLLELDHVGLIVPGLDLERHNGLLTARNSCSKHIVRIRMYI